MVGNVVTQEVERKRNTGILQLGALAGLGLTLFLPGGTPQAGTIVGKVVLDGQYTVAGKTAMDADALIRAERSVVLSPKHALANAVISVLDVPGQYPPPEDSPELDQKEKTYKPHVLPIISGQKIDIVNSDGILHNVHAYAADKTVFNLAMPPFRKHAVMEVPPQGVTMVACDVHRHMRAWVIPLDNPFFAVSRETGLFSIKGVPAGTYKIRAWHEIFGTVEQTITVKDGEAKTPVVFKFVVKP